MLVHSQPVDNTECFAWQGASSCNGKHPNIVNLVGRLLSSCRFAFDSDDERFACSRSMEISNLSLSQSYECHHPGSRIGKKEANCRVKFL
jgi:hypothetical protein